MRRLHQLTTRRRPARATLALGLLMAFNAGAVNAGGFMVLSLYTSHMTGFISMIADHVVLGNTALVLAAVGAIAAFVAGAGTSAMLVAMAQVWRLRSTYALPLLLVAALMLIFGLVGAVTLRWDTPFAVPMTALLLSFTMGVQNATLTKMSKATIRTTHMTGVVTDLGIELGRWLFVRYCHWLAQRGLWMQQWVQPTPPSYEKAQMFMALLLMFLLGAVLGATGFAHLGFVCVLPLALVLVAVSAPPLVADWRRLRALALSPSTYAKTPQ